MVVVWRRHIDVELAPLTPIPPGHWLAHIPHLAEGVRAVQAGCDLAGPDVCAIAGGGPRIGISTGDSRMGLGGVGSPGNTLA
jgi:hypothetical protein